MAAKFTFIWTRNKMSIEIQIKPFFSICCAKLYDLGAEENIYDFYCSSSDL